MKSSPAPSPLKAARVWVRITRDVRVEGGAPRAGSVVSAEIWPFPHAAEYLVEEARFRHSVRIMVAGNAVRLWPEEYEECGEPPLFDASIFAELEDGEEL